MIRFVDVASQHQMSQIHVQTSFLLNVVSGVVDIKAIAIDQLKERGLDKFGERLENYDPFEVKELEEELFFVERNSLCTRGDVLAILNSNIAPYNILRRRLSEVLKYIMWLKNRGHDNDYIINYIKHNRKEVFGDVVVE